MRRIIAILIAVMLALTSLAGVFAEETAPDTTEAMEAAAFEDDLGGALEQADYVSLSEETSTEAVSDWISLAAEENEGENADGETDAEADESDFEVAQETSALTEEADEIHTEQAKTSEAEIDGKLFLGAEYRGVFSEVKQSLLLRIYIGQITKARLTQSGAAVKLTICREDNVGDPIELISVKDSDGAVLPILKTLDLFEGFYYIAAERLGDDDGGVFFLTITDTATKANDENSESALETDEVNTEEGDMLENTEAASESEADAMEEALDAPDAFDSDEIASYDAVIAEDAETTDEDVIDTLDDIAYEPNDETAESIERPDDVVPGVDETGDGEIKAENAQEVLEDPENDSSDEGEFSYPAEEAENGAESDTELSPMDEADAEAANEAIVDAESEAGDDSSDAPLTAEDAEDVKAAEQTESDLNGESKDADVNAVESDTQPMDDTTSVNEDGENDGGDREIGVYLTMSSMDGSSYGIGSEIVLKANLVGVGADEYLIYWQYSPDGGETVYEVEGANETEYRYVIDETNISYIWRVMIVPLQNAETE